MDTNFTEIVGSVSTVVEAAFEPRKGSVQDLLRLFEARGSHASVFRECESSSWKRPN